MNQRMISRILLTVVLLSLVFSMGTGTAFAGEYPMGIKYFPEAGNSWLYGIEESQYMLGAYGKGEKVKFYGVGYFPEARLQYKVSTKFYGQEAYLEDKVIWKPSGFIYETKPIFKTIVLNGKIDIYKQPRYESEKRTYMGKTLYAVAQTSGWYKVVLGGKAEFISKKDVNIKKVKTAKFPKIDVSKIEKENKNNVKNRVKYQFAVLPEKVRDMILDMRLRIMVTPEFGIKEKEAGAESYHKGRCIYLKEDKNVRLETNILLEIGRIFLEQEICKKDQNLASAFIAAAIDRDSIPYMEARFQMFVRRPELLEELVPYVYYIYYDILA